MSLSSILDGEFWADDGDCDEPDGDRPDERVTRSGGWQDQDRRGIGVDGTWAASEEVHPRVAGSEMLRTPDSASFGGLTYFMRID
jgi:hypothetical protein